MSDESRGTGARSGRSGSHRRPRRRGVLARSGSARLALAAAAAVIVASGGAVVAFATADPGWVALPSAKVLSLPGATQADPDPQKLLQLRIYFAGRDPAGRAREALAVSTPGNPQYGHFLTPAEFEQRYGPTREQMDRVRDYAQSQKMIVTASNQHFLTVTATVAQAEAAFHTKLKTYKQLNEIVAPADDAFLPADRAGDVATVVGLQRTDFPLGNGGPEPGTVPERTGGASGGVSPRRAAHATEPTLSCSHWWGEHTAQIPAAFGHTTASTTPCAYTPAQLRHAYGIDSSRYTGKGATVAVLGSGRLGPMEADANRFFDSRGIPGFAPGQFTTVEDLAGDSCPDDQVGSENYLESALDVETVHIASPNAKVVWVGTSCYRSDGHLEYLDAGTKIVDEHLGDVVTSSFVEAESDYSPAVIAAWDLTLQQGALEGIGFNIASGDCGDCLEKDELFPGTNQRLLFPATDPWATAVGGTVLALGRNGEPVAEYGWTTWTATMSGNGYEAPPPGEFDAGSGGGRSEVCAQPPYQQAVVSEPLATRDGKGPAHRVVPDIAANAGVWWEIGLSEKSEDGAVIPDAVEWVGGTSGSAPLVAGLMANAKEATGHAVGFANPALYRMRGTPAIRDVLPVDPADPPIAARGRRSDPAPTWLYSYGPTRNNPVGVGYDPVTGLGTPGASFVTAFPQRG